MTLNSNKVIMIQNIHYNKLKIDKQIIMNLEKIIFQILKIKISNCPTSLK